jgi:hypothetical protein
MAIKHFVYQIVDGTPRPLPADAPLWLHVHEDIVELLAEQGAASAVVTPIPPLGEHVAALLVADDCPSDITRNGRPLSAGLWPLKHADRLEINGHALWIAVETAHDHDHYDPAVHGADVHCLYSKARLIPGDDIVVCPCGAIYKLAAWQMAERAARRFKCPSCGYAPTAPRWQPTIPQPARTLDNLQALIANSSL